MSQNEQTPSDAMVEVTDFFAGSDRARERMLAQPESTGCTCDFTICGTCAYCLNQYSLNGKVVALNNNKSSTKYKYHGG